MKKKTLFTMFASLGLVFCASLVALNLNEPLSGVKGAETSTWRHYSAVQATESSNGSREYWTDCIGGAPVFTDPGVSAIDATPTQEFLSTLSSNDPRYTAYTPNAFKSEGNFWRYFRIGAWGDCDYANGVVGVNSSFTVNYQLIVDAHELGYKYIYFNLDAVSSDGSDDIGAVVLFTANTKGTFNGNGWNQINLPAGITINVDDFYGKYTGEYKDGATIFTAEFRNQSNNANNNVKATFKNLKLFKDKETLATYKKLAEMTNGDGYDYFHRGSAPESDNRTIYFTGNGGRFTATQQLVSEAKKAGVRTISFNLRVTSSLNTDLRRVVFITNDGAVSGTYEGQPIVWSTDWNVIEAESGVIASTGVRVTFNLYKFFGEDIVMTAEPYFISLRLAGSDNDYQNSEDTLSYYLTDFILK